MFDHTHVASLRASPEIDRSRVAAERHQLLEAARTSLLPRQPLSLMGRWSRLAARSRARVAALPTGRG